MLLCISLRILMYLHMYCFYINIAKFLLCGILLLKRYHVRALKLSSAFPYKSSQFHGTVSLRQLIYQINS